MDLLSDRDPEIRLSSATALGQLKSGRSVEALTGLLKERSEHIAIRQQAAISLAAIRSTGAIREMKEFVADKNEEAAIRSYTEEILAKIGTW
jgi:HEAT repeat protein